MTFIYHKLQVTAIMTLTVLGTSKISKQNKITLIEQAMKELKLEPGEILVFYKNDNGDVIIRGQYMGVE